MRRRHTNSWPYHFWRIFHIILDWLFNHKSLVVFIIFIIWLSPHIRSCTIQLAEEGSILEGDVIKSEDQELNGDAPMFYIVAIGSYQINTIKYNCSGMEWEPVRHMKNEFLDGKYEVLKPPCLPSSIKTNISQYVPTR